MKIVMYRGKGKQPYRWRLVADNGKVIADSAEGYAKRRNLILAADRVRFGARSGIPAVWR